MSRADNTRHLLEAAAARRQNALMHARGALAELTRTGQPITFTAVARAGGVSRSWLYTEPDLRDAITRLRRELPATRNPVPIAERATPESLRQRIEALRTEAVALRAENLALREQVARSLGLQRARLVEDMSSTQKS